MFVECLGEDDDIIHVDKDFPMSDQVMEYIIHHCLECGQGIGKSKEHNQWFEESTIGSKSCFGFVTFLNPNIVVTPPNIKFGEVFCTLKFVDQL